MEIKNNKISSNAKKKKFKICYSQFIEVDINKKNECENFKRACNIRDFEEWVLKNHNIKIVPINYLLNVGEITKYLKKFLNMDFSGWRIEPLKIAEDEILIRSKEEEKILKVGEILK